MPLTVHEYDTSFTNAMQLYSASTGVLNDRRGDVGQGAFWTATNPQENTYLGTSGAGPCVIILVHAANGVGALGHLDGASEAWQVISGLAQMMHGLNYPDVDTILFSAGIVAQNADRKAQKVFELAVIGECNAAYPNAWIRWPQHPGGINNYGACIYQPTQGVAALYDSYPGMWVGDGSTARGLRAHGFRAARDTLRHKPGLAP